MMFPMPRQLSRESSHIDAVPGKSHADLPGLECSVRLVQLITKEIDD
jgi:hypothetical protein